MEKKGEFSESSFPALLFEFATLFFKINFSGRVKFLYSNSVLVVCLSGVKFVSG